jgi:hypothetical protein
MRKRHVPGREGREDWGCYTVRVDHLFIFVP